MIASTGFTGRGFFVWQIGWLCMENSNIDISLLREQVCQYVERCRMEDGGYFFARIPPSSAMDTYYAVKSLSMLGLQPECPAATMQFFFNALNNSSSLGLNGLFAAAESLADLDSSFELPARYLSRINKLKNSMGGFGVVRNIDIAVVSELETTYRVLKILDRLALGYDKEQVTGFVRAFQNKDGGFGRDGISTLASTFYATAVFDLVGYQCSGPSLIIDYLRGKENVWNLNFIEDIYWLSHSLVRLGQRPRLADWILSFIRGCQRTNGGFSRKDVMGIPTLEDTFYAVSIFRILSYL
jgi:hypothetical protein